MTYYVKFEKMIQEAKILSPSTGFTPQTQAVERRKDTLLDRWCRINIERASRPKDRAGDSSVMQLVESSQRNCPFCPGRIDASTPMFPKEIVPEGRLKVGEAVAFPNLFAFAQHHAVVVLTREHFLPLDGFKPEIIKNGLDASIMYLKAVRASNPQVRFCSINWNFMPTAAASMVHPHLQIIADETPTRYINEAMEASQRFIRKNGVSYWDDLVEAERECGDRFIADVGESRWLASFCGLGNNDVVGIFAKSSLFELSEEALNDIAEGLSIMLRGYHSIGVQGFNLSLYSGPLNVKTQGFNVHLHMISRPDIRAMYTADTGFMERLHDEIVVETRPEDVALRIRGVVNRPSGRL